jgi:hypothetical protein
MKVYEIISGPRVQLDENWLVDTIKGLFKSGAKGASKEAVLSFIKHSSEEYANVLLQAEKRGTQPPDLVKFLDEQAKGATGGKQGFMDMDPAFTSKETLDLINSNARKILKDLRKGATATAKAGADAATKESVKKTILGLTRGQTLWLGGNGLIAGSTIYSIIDTYFNNMAQARAGLADGEEYFQKLEAAGQLKNFPTIDGRPVANIEEWFVLFHRRQVELAIAKILQALAQTAIVGLVAFNLLKFSTLGLAGSKTLWVLGPPAYNMILAKMADNADPWGWAVDLIATDILGVASTTTWVAEIYQKFQLPNDSAVRAKFQTALDSVNKSVSADNKKSQDNNPTGQTTPVGQGGKDDTTNGTTTQEPNVTTPDEQPAVATPVDKSTWKRDWQGYPINPATGNAELDN